jgi:hypothetical protein
MGQDRLMSIRALPIAENMQKLSRSMGSTVAILTLHNQAKCLCFRRFSVVRSEIFWLKPAVCVDYQSIGATFFVDSR